MNSGYPHHPTSPLANGHTPGGVTRADEWHERDHEHEYARGANDPDRIRAEIEATRAAMGETMGAIGTRLSPERLKHDASETIRAEIKGRYEEAKSTVRDATIGRVENMMEHAGHGVRSAQRTVVDTVRENPVPAALAFIGLAWLFANRRKDNGSVRPYRGPRELDEAYYTERRREHAMRREPFAGESYGGYGQFASTGYATRGSAPYPNGIPNGVGGHAYGTGAEHEGGVLDEAAQRAKDAAEGARHAAGEAYDRVREGARDIGHRAEESFHTLARRTQETGERIQATARDQAHRVEDRFNETLEQNPLVLGALAVAAGAAVGAILPRTAKEDQLLGSARDELLHNVKETAQSAASKGKEIAGELGQEAKVRVKEEIGAATR
jgi:hypothetical protein